MMSSENEVLRSKRLGTVRNRSCVDEVEIGNQDAKNCGQSIEISTLCPELGIRVLVRD